MSSVMVALVTVEPVNSGASMTQGGAVMVVRVVADSGAEGKVVARSVGGLGSY